VTAGGRLRARRQRADEVARQLEPGLRDLSARALPCRKRALRHPCFRRDDLEIMSDATRRANQSSISFAVRPFENILIFRRRKSLISAAVPLPEGRCATSRNAERDAVDAAARLTAMRLADGEVVWS